MREGPAKYPPKYPPPFRSIKPILFAWLKSKWPKGWLSESPFNTFRIVEIKMTQRDHLAQTEMCLTDFLPGLPCPCPACQISKAPFGTFMFVPNGLKAGTCQVAYQTVAHLASGGQSWQPFAKYP